MAFPYPTSQALIDLRYLDRVFNFDKYDCSGTMLLRYWGYLAVYVMSEVELEKKLGQDDGTDDPRKDLLPQVKHHLATTTSIHPALNAYQIR